MDFENKNIKSIIKYDNIYYLEYFSEQTGITFILISNIVSTKNVFLAFNQSIINIFIVCSLI